MSPSEYTWDLNRTNRRSERGRDTPFWEKPSRRRRESGASRARARMRERERSGTASGEYEARGEAKDGERHGFS